MAIRIPQGFVFGTVPPSGSNYVMGCMCGKGHKTNLSCKLYMNALTIAELVDLIAKQGYKAKVTEEEGTGYVRVITYATSLPEHVKEVVRASVPAGVVVQFATDEYKIAPIPDSLKTWAQFTAKEMKK